MTCHFYSRMDFCYKHCRFSLNDARGKLVQKSYFRFWDWMGMMMGIGSGEICRGLCGHRLGIGNFIWGWDTDKENLMGMGTG